MKKYFLFSVITLIVFSDYMLPQTETAQNPFFMDWTTPFQTPPFDQIKDEHFLPALMEGINQRRSEIDAIINNPDTPTFENTIGAMERSGKFLSKVNRVFSNLNSANSNPNLQKVAEQITPELSKLSNYIYLNETLFNRIKAVYYEKEKLALSKEELRVLENYYLDFVRSGIALNDEDKTKLKEINNELSMLQLKFSDNLRKETNAIGLVIDNPDDLVGLPDAVIQGAKELAEQNGMKGKWASNLTASELYSFSAIFGKKRVCEKFFIKHI
jgi:peptidyl-dipeptidase Dcp